MENTKTNFSFDSFLVLVYYMVNVLLSLHNPYSTGTGWIRMIARKRMRGECSGVASIWTLGNAIDIDDFCEFNP